jgi:hypothetical protein
MTPWVRPGLIWRLSQTRKPPHLTGRLFCSVKLAAAGIFPSLPFGRFTSLSLAGELAARRQPDSTANCHPWCADLKLWPA